MGKEFLTVRDVAELLGQSEDWVRTCLKTGKIPAFKLYPGARKWYVKAADLDAMIGKQRAETEGSACQRIPRR